MFSNPIPEPEKGKDDANGIPRTVAERPQTEESPEVLPYRISFARYNQGECQMDEMNPKNAKVVLTTLRDVGVHFTSEENYSVNSGKAEIKKIICAGDYRGLFRGLGEDAEIKEIKCTHPSKGVDVRLFYFSLERDKTFYLVATRETHYDTDKGNYQHRSFRNRR